MLEKAFYNNSKGKFAIYIPTKDITEYVKSDEYEINYIGEINDYLSGRAIATGVSEYCSEGDIIVADNEAYYIGSNGIDELKDFIEDRLRYLGDEITSLMDTEFDEEYIINQSQMPIMRKIGMMVQSKCILKGGYIYTQSGKRVGFYRTDGVNWIKLPDYLGLKNVPDIYNDFDETDYEEFDEITDLW